MKDSCFLDIWVNKVNNKTYIYHSKWYITTFITQLSKQKVILTLHAFFIFYNAEFFLCIDDTYSPRSLMTQLDHRYPKHAFIVP